MWGETLEILMLRRTERKERFLEEKKKKKKAKPNHTRAFFEAMVENAHIRTL